MNWYTVVSIATVLTYIISIVALGYILGNVLKAFARLLDEDEPASWGQSAFYGCCCHRCKMKDMIKKTDDE